MQGPMLGSVNEARRGKMCSVPLGSSPWEKWPCKQWLHSYCWGRDNHVYSGHTHTALGETAMYTVDTFTLLWERQPYIQWTHSHCCGRDSHVLQWTHSHCCGRNGHVYSGHSHTAVGEMAMYTADTFTLLWERWLCIQQTHSHCCEKDNHYSVNSVTWNLAYHGWSVSSCWINELIGASKQEDKSAIGQVPNVMKI